MSDAAKLSQLDRETDPSLPIGRVVRPETGWLRAIREALDLSIVSVARRLKITPPAVRSFEQAEAEDRITLASLRRTAAAMNCDLVYALVPRTGSLAALAESETRAKSAGLAQETPAPEEVDKKVTDKTWRTLHGDA